MARTGRKKVVGVYVQDMERRALQGEGQYFLDLFLNRFILRFHSFFHSISSVFLFSTKPFLLSRSDASYLSKELRGVKFPGCYCNF